VSVEVSKAEKRKLSTAAKTMIAAVLGLIAVFLIWTLVERSAKNRRTVSYNRMVAAAAMPDATEVPVNKIDLDILLEASVNTGVVENRTAIYQALTLAKGTDGTDLDASIAEFATKHDMLPDVREILIRDVLRKRNNSAIVPTLMTFARDTTDARAAVASLQAVRFMAGEAQFDAFLELILSSRPPAVRKAAEDTLSEIIKKSPSTSHLATKFAAAYGDKLNPETRQTVLRLLGRCGGPKALELVKKALEGTDKPGQISAIVALGTWVDDSAYPLLIGFIASTEDANLRAKAFSAAVTFALATSTAKDTVRAQKQWMELVAQAKASEEKHSIINSLANLDDEWAIKILEGFKSSDDGKVSQRAEKAIDYINKRNPSKSKSR
jgi:HEAT repeat protein